MMGESVVHTTETLPVVGRSSIDLLDHPDVATHGAMVLIDKQPGWTSFDVVARLRSILRIRRIGHCGTLDPMATGLLQICIGPATKLVESIQSGVKEYLGSMRFGASTPSDDAETEIDHTYPFDHLTFDRLRSAAHDFVGTIDQIPPMYSARKVDGKRLYKLARRGEVVDRPSRSVTIELFEIESFTPPDADFRVVCSRGTYVRSLVRDLGTNVGSGAYMTALRRLRSGNYCVDDAVTVEEIAEWRRTGTDSSEPTS